MAGVNVGLCGRPKRETPTEETEKMMDRFTFTAIAISLVTTLPSVLLSAADAPQSPVPWSPCPIATDNLGPGVLGFGISPPSQNCPSGEVFLKVRLKSRDLDKRWLGDLNCPLARIIRLLGGICG